jgi:hypothetical protein
VRKKGMSPVQSNRRSQQKPSAKRRKRENSMVVMLIPGSQRASCLRNHAFCSRNMGAHVRCTSAKKLVSCDFTKILKVATKIRETCDKTLFTPPSLTKATNSIISVKAIRGRQNCQHMFSDRLSQNRQRAFSNTT